MTQHKFKYLLAVIGLVISFSACKDYLDVNVDPNQSTTSRIDLQLSSAQLQTAIGLDQRIYGTVNIWAQYWTGGPGVSIGEADQHKLSSTEGNEIFRTLMRSSNNLNYIIKNSTNSNYLAIAKVLKAYNFQVLVDLFGDVPYSEALKGDISDGSILHPVYDDDQAIYQSLEAEVLDGIRLINAGALEDTPGADDLIYGGHMDQWLKFANTLLLKIYLRQGEAGRAEASTQFAASTDEDFIIANADNAMVQFTGEAGAINPAWNAAFSTALGVYYVATTTVIDYLVNTSDPRLTYFFEPDAAGQYTGLYPGDVEAQPLNKTFAQPNGANSSTGGIIYNPSAPVILISAWEGNLLLAEAKARGWFGTDDGVNYEDAVAASFEFLGVPDSLRDNYLAGPAAYDAGADLDTKLNAISLQKWISMNGLQPVEAWIEVRRFDTPSNHLFYGPGGLFHVPVKNALGGNTYPTILPYPENEQSLNQNFPGPHSLTDMVFWDN